MKASIFGIGYVGLVQAAVLAAAGHEIMCVDVDEEKIARLKLGQIPIYEPGLENLVKEGVSSGRLHFTSSAEEGVRFSGIQFIAVGTPPDEDGSADLKYVLAVARSIAQHMQGHQIVINKSTVPVGTADKVTAAMHEVLKARGKDDLTFDVASNPEFLKEGSAVADASKPDRIVIGTSSSDTEETLRELYASSNRNHEKIIVMDVRSAELTKYAANCMLATKISFMNEMANLAELLGADIEAVRKGIGSDQRIGYHFIYPGLGYGGSCFPKDVQALIRSAENINFDARVLKAVEARNEEQKTTLFNKIMKHYGGNVEGKTFALWGLSFKPNTDDMREAPSRTLMEALWKAGAKVQAFDPVSMEETQRIYADHPALVLCGTKEMALRGADALCICTEWKTFVAPDFDGLKAQLAQPVIFDGRNLYEPARMRKRGFSYYSVGRATV